MDRSSFAMSRAWSTEGCGLRSGTAGYDIPCAEFRRGGASARGKRGSRGITE